MVWGTCMLRSVFFSADFRRCLPISAKCCKKCQNMHLFELISRARWAIVHISTQSLEHFFRAPFLRPGSAFFGFLALFSSIWPNFRRCSSNLGCFLPVLCFLGRFPATSSKSMQFCCFAKHPQDTPIPQYDSTTAFSYERRRTTARGT